MRVRGTSSRRLRVGSKPVARRADACYWDRADDDTDMWETTCGNAFVFTDDGPAQNGFRWCPYCGAALLTGVRVRRTE